jgi:hypothetical protein
MRGRRDRRLGQSEAAQRETYSFRHPTCTVNDLLVMYARREAIYE